MKASHGLLLSGGLIAKRRRPGERRNRLRQRTLIHRSVAPSSCRRGLAIKGRRWPAARLRPWRLLWVGRILPYGA